MMKDVALGFLMGVLTVFGTVSEAFAQGAQSTLKNDPEVYYFDEDGPNGNIEFIVAQDTEIYRDKNGKSSLRVISKGERVKLVAMSDRAYRIKGGSKYGQYLGWVNPHHMASKDPEFVENLKKFYDRELAVEQMIANNEVAIGMTQAEVERSLGQPTKTTVKVTAEGQVSTWEFIEFEEKRHFVTVRDSFTGAFYRRFSHTTREEIGKVSIEFSENLVISLERKEQAEGAGRVRIVSRPIILVR